ncbi:restriction endonuclease [Paenibacillus motobuensis]|uniref:YD repeat protein n=1 Tax=Paenibacillus motobuensis TaxID=295324 RepID=A0ABP3I735_9BACL
MKKIVMLFAAIILIFSSIGTVSADYGSSHLGETNDVISCSEYDGDIRYEYDENGNPIKKIVSIKDTEKYAESQGFTLPSPDAEIELIFPINTIINDNQAYETTSSISPLAGNDFYIKKVSGPTKACGSNVIRRSIYSAPGGTMTVSEGISASFSASVNISAAVVSAGVNFSVTSSFNVSDSQTVSIPSGKSSAEVTARPILDVYSFEIWEKDLFFDDYVGNGSAYKPVGVCFQVVYY